MLTHQDAARLIETEFNRLVNIDINFLDRPTVYPVVYRPSELIMAEKTVATLLSKTVEHTPEYSGKPDQDADGWLKDLTATFRMADIAESQALEIISTFWKGMLNNAEFIHTYSSPTTKQLASNRLRTRQQRYDEAVIEYYTDIMKLCKLVDPNMTDASKLDHLYHGLRSSLMKEVLRQALATSSKFLEQVRREENLDRLVNTSVHQTNDNNALAMNYPNNSVYRPIQFAEAMHYEHSPNMYSDSYSTNAFSTRPTYTRFHQQSSPRYVPQAQQSSFNALRFQPRPLRCYRCNKLGHTARDCRSAKN